jgi:hypothetical protein
LIAQYLTFFKTTKSSDQNICCGKYIVKKFMFMEHQQFEGLLFNPLPHSTHRYLVPITPINEGFNPLVNLSAKFIGLTDEGPKIHTLDEWDHIDPYNYALFRVTSNMTRLDNSEIASLKSRIVKLENMIKNLTAPKKLNLLDYISEDLFNRIKQIQEDSYLAYKPRIDEVMCCVCLEESIKIVPLKCCHELCKSCYEKLKCNSCPICRRPLEIKTIHKLIAVFTKINQNDLAIFYLPPIKNDEGWIEHDMFQNIGDDKNELRRFLTVCNQINEELYSVVINGDILNEWTRFNVVRNLKIIG